MNNLLRQLVVLFIVSLLSLEVFAETNDTRAKENNKNDPKIKSEEKSLKPEQKKEENTEVKKKSEKIEARIEAKIPKDIKGNVEVDIEGKIRIRVIDKDVVVNTNQENNDGEVIIEAQEMETELIDKSKFGESKFGESLKEPEIQSQIQTDEQLYKENTETHTEETINYNIQGQESEYDTEEEESWQYKRKKKYFGGIPDINLKFYHKEKKLKSKIEDLNNRLRQKMIDMDNKVNGNNEYEVNNERHEIIEKSENEKKKDNRDCINRSHRLPGLIEPPFIVRYKKRAMAKKNIFGIEGIYPRIGINVDYDELNMMNISFQYGANIFYGICKLGFRFSSDAALIGFGMGGYIPIFNRIGANIELTGGNIRTKHGFFNDSLKSNILVKLNIGANIKVIKNMNIVAGFSYNYYRAFNIKGESQMPGITHGYKFSWSDNKNIHWPGFYFGIRAGFNIKPGARI